MLGALADGAIMVTGSGLVSREQVTAAASSLERVNATLLGVVLNRAPQSKRGGYDYRYYDYQAAEAESGSGRRSRKERKADVKGDKRKRQKAEQASS